MEYKGSRLVAGTFLKTKVMIYTFKVFFQTDSDVPGDSGKRSKTVRIAADNYDDACEDVYNKYADEEYAGYELISEKIL